MPSKLMQRFATPLAPQLEGREVRTVVFVGIAFHAIFIGHRSIQNLQSSLNEEKGLGVISLGVLYGAWIFSGILTPTVLRLLTTKGAMMVAWVCHVLYTAATFYPSWGLLLPASILVGALSAPLWTAQSLYMTACGYSHARHASDNPYHIFSRFNGIFFAIYETSQITGNLVSSLVLQNGIGNRSEEIHFWQCGRGDCPAADNATDFEEPEDWVIDVLLATYVACNFIGIAVTYFFVMPLPKSDWNVVTSTKQSVTSLFAVLRSTAIALLVPLFIFQGMQQAVLFSEFTRSYISCPVGIHMVGFVMAAHGATTPVVTLLFSRVVKHTGRYPLFMLAGLINLGLMVVMYKWTPDDGDMAFIFLAPICWGLSEGIWLTQTNSVIAVEFPDQKEPAFAIYHTSRSVGLALTFAYSSFLCASVKLTVGVVFVLTGLLFYTVAEVRIRWKEKLASSRPPRGDDKANSLNGGGAVSTVSTSAMRLSDVTFDLPHHQNSASLPAPVRDGDFGVDLERVCPTPDIPGTELASLPGGPVPGGLPSMASSSSSSILAITARLSQSDDDVLTSLPSAKYLSGHRLSEEPVF